MFDPLMIYGATGYSGRLVTSVARQRGMRPLLCGRNQGKVAAVARRFGLPHRVARLEKAEELEAALEGVAVVLHAAGPFSQTSPPMIDACLRTGTHYLDLTAEVRVIEALARRSSEARKRGIMIMPAVGFDVVPSDCLAAHVHARLPTASRLVLGLQGLRFVTRGSARTLMEAVDFGVMRREGALVTIPLGSRERMFDFGRGPEPALNISWGDVATAYYTTGIPNVETYYQASPLLRGVLATCRQAGWLLRTAPFQALLKAQADMLPEGPREEERARAGMVIVAEASDERGVRVASRLRTPEAYTFTGTAAASVAMRALAGDLEAGFQTPARVFGPDFVLHLEGVSREDLA